MKAPNPLIMDLLDELAVMNIFAADLPNTPASNAIKAQLSVLQYLLEIQL